MTQDLLQVELFFALMYLTYVAGKYCFSSLVSTSGSFFPHILNTFGIEEGKVVLMNQVLEEGTQQTKQCTTQTISLPTTCKSMNHVEEDRRSPVENGPRGLQTSNLPHHHAPRIRSWRYPRCQLDLPTPTNAGFNQSQNPTWQ